MKAAVLGTGDVGRNLASGFARLGHDVMMGSRDPAKMEVQEWVKATGARASAGTFAKAAAFGDVVALATSWEGTENALRLAGAENFRGKVVMDVTNPLAHPPEGGLPGLAVGHTTSGGEEVQRWLPEARVVKALNIVNNQDMTQPRFEGGNPHMLICGDDADAKDAVTGILEAWGWPVMDLGGLDGSRLLEPLCILWVNVGVVTGHWDHAFKIVRREG